MLNKEKRYEEILSTLAKYGAMTAREIADQLGYQERNATAPRLTELVKKGKVMTAGKRLDRWSNVKVNTYRLVDESDLFCKKCGMPLDKVSRVWRTCSHCGQMQMTPTKEENEINRKILNN